MYDYDGHGNIDFSDTEPPKHDFGDGKTVRIIRTQDIYQVDPEEDMGVYSPRIVELAGTHRARRHPRRLQRGNHGRRFQARGTRRSAVRRD